MSRLPVGALDLLANASTAKIFGMTGMTTDNHLLIDDLLNRKIIDPLNVMANHFHPKLANQVGV